MPTIHLIEGPVGAGKSTFAAQLSREHKAPRLILDDWYATLFRPDRPATGVMPWYAERKQRCLVQIWKTACALVESGSDVVLELGLIEQKSRRRFYEQVDAAGHALKVYVLDASRQTRRERVQQRNEAQGATFSMVVPDEFFELASDLWEAPDETETAGRDFRFISTEFTA